MQAFRIHLTSYKIEKRIEKSNRKYGSKRLKLQDDPTKAKACEFKLRLQIL